MNIFKELKNLDLKSGELSKFVKWLFAISTDAKLMIFCLVFPKIVKIGKMLFRLLVWVTLAGLLVIFYLSTK